MQWRNLFCACIFLCGLLSNTTTVVGDDILQEIVLGISLTLDPLSQSSADSANYDPTAFANRYVNSQKTHNGLTLWQDTFGELVHTYENASVKYSLVIMEDNGNATRMVENYQRMSNDPNINFLIGPMQTDFTILAEPTWESSQKLMISTSSASEDIALTGSWSYSLLTPSNRLLLSALQMYQLVGIDTVACISENVLQYTQTCNSLWDNAGTYQMNVVGNVTLSAATGGVLSEVQLKENMEAMKFIQSLNPDLLIVCAYPAHTQQTLLNSEALNYLPKAFHVCSFHPELLDMPQAQYTTASTSWLNTVSYPSDQWFGTSQTYSSEFSQRFQTLPDTVSALASLVPIVFEQAVKSSMETHMDYESDHVRSALSRLDLNTFYGNIAFSLQHVCLHDNLVVQLVGSKVVAIAPFSVSVADVVYPIPSFKQRVFDMPKYFGTVSQIYVAVIDILFLFGNVVLSVITFIFWPRQIYLHLSLLGSTFLLLGVFLWMEVINFYTCSGLPWLIGFGFVLLYHSLIIIAWKVDTSSSNESMLPLSRLLKVSGLLVAIELLLLILLGTISPLQNVMLVLDPLRPAENKLSCQGSELLTPIFLAAIALYDAILLLYGLVLSFRVFSTSKYISLSMMSFAVFVIVALIVQMNSVYVKTGQTATFVLRSFGIMLAAEVSVWILYFPRLRKIFRKSKEKSETVIHDNNNKTQEESESSNSDMDIEMDFLESLGSQSVTETTHYETNDMLIVESLQAEVEVQRIKIKELEEMLTLKKKLESASRNSNPPSPTLASVPSQFVNPNLHNLTNTNTNTNTNTGTSFSPALSFASSLIHHRSLSPPLSPQVSITSSTSTPSSQYTSNQETNSSLNNSNSQNNSSSQFPQQYSRRPPSPLNLNDETEILNTSDDAIT
eukprot:TRINITY_DN5629_c0_g1_i4.p1 TRINITY_DN5629_c0_g1~~TRINITY_DN5629_c0_g1_i4.p1  ORF type:complete len:898 (-),score=147.62 TRINITY_DN5629_c0_g1_i4:65-2758(-)